jgi:uncharacterized LabA/DUF88 family protein
LKNRRVIAYVDGFNLYFGLKSKRWRRYYWLNIYNMIKLLLHKNHSLVLVKYFTSRIRGEEEKIRRQNTFIDALKTIKDFRIFFGSYRKNEETCSKCGNSYIYYQEKKTDVNIATELLVDAFEDSFDTALIVSADSDLAGPIISLKRLFKNKQLVLAFPPARHSNELKKIAHASFVIPRSVLAKSQFPRVVVAQDGTKLTCPNKWQ